MKIKAWSDEDKPREKLIGKGKSVLSDAELLTILIGSGNREENALDVSKKILLSVANDLNVLGKLNADQLMRFKGIGKAKAITIIAALELGKRQRKTTIKKVISSKSVFDLMQPLLGELAHEEFWVLFLNHSNFILSKEQLSKGGITATVVDLRLLFKMALEKTATAVILCHNHPSGGLTPSQEDVVLTNKIQEAGKRLDIKVLDHLIITETSYYSFADEGML